MAHNQRYAHALKQKERKMYRWQQRKKERKNKKGDREKYRMQHLQNAGAVDMYWLIVFEHHLTDC